MENPCKIIFFGDSITKEFTPKLEKILRKEFPKNKIEVINAGIVGETSRDGLKRIDGLLKQKPTVVVIGFGMNDWIKGVDEYEYKKNISKMVDEFEKIDTRVFLTTINPNYHKEKGTSSKIDEYSEVIRNIAREKRIKIADVNSLWKRRFNPVQKGLRDELHPNEEGYKVYLESLMHVVPQSHTTILWQYNGRECHCNYHCPYCYYAAAPKLDDFFFGKIEQWRKVFKKAFGNQRLIFYLAFGEPTIGKNFYDVVKMIESEPKWSLRITSNISQNLKRLVNTELAKEGRLFINASFHPTQTTKEEFLKKLLFLRRNGIEAPIVYVMWPPHLKRFESDFEFFNKHNFLIHVRRFGGKFKGKIYPRDYTDEERRFIAKYCDDTTIKFMLNENVFIKKYWKDRRTYSGFHFFIVDCVGNLGFDSDCFPMYSKYRTIFGNIIQYNNLKIPLEPQEYPNGFRAGTVDGAANLFESGYHQLEQNNVLHFAKQGGVYYTKEGKVHYKHMNTDFTNKKIMKEYYFPIKY